MKKIKQRHVRYCIQVKERGSDDISLDKFYGCLIGGAAGDALGYEIEFLGEDTIFRNFGKEGIQDYVLHIGEARISDDTQMTLFTAAGLLSDFQAKSAGGNLSVRPESAIWDAYLEWYELQCGNTIKNAKSGWLCRVPEMAASRAPGITCLHTLGNKQAGCTGESINHSKGCGGVMRVAPIGLFYNRHPELKDEIVFVDRLAAEAAALTHGHPLGYLTAAVLAHIVNRIVYGGCTFGDGLKDIVLESIEYLKGYYSEQEHTRELCDLIQKAIDLSQNEEDDLDNIHILGEGWVAEETLAIAVYCALKYQNDFSKALCVSVNHRGDSDSTGAVTGNILGAWVGYERIPEKWKQNLECYDTIKKMAEELYQTE